MTGNEPGHEQRTDLSDVHKSTSQVGIADRWLVQQGVAGPPFGQELIHKLFETIVMGAFKQMCHFVNDNIFQALLWFSGKFRADANGSGSWVAATPAGFHLSNEEGIDVNPQQGFPFAEKRWNCLIHL